MLVAGVSGVERTSTRAAGNADCGAALDECLCRQSGHMHRCGGTNVPGCPDVPAATLRDRMAVPNAYDLAAYRRCVGRVRASWRPFADRRAQWLAQDGRGGPAT